MKTKLFPIAIALFFVSASLRADVTPGNTWHNPTFESGMDLNLPTGTPDFWNRGGADGSILQPSTANSVSPTHSLAVNKPSAGPYGEWYSDLSLVGLAGFGDTVSLHWHEMYSISGGEMRVTVRFLDGGGNGPDNHFVVTGNSAGWAGSAAASTFSVRNIPIVVNQPGAVTMRIQLVSGGGDSTTGIYLIDDLAVATPQLRILSITRLAEGTVRLEASGVPNRSHTIQATADLRAPFTAIGSVTAGADGTFQFNDPDAPSFLQRFYRAALP